MSIMRGDFEVGVVQHRHNGAIVGIRFSRRMQERLREGVPLFLPPRVAWSVGMQLLKSALQTKWAQFKARFV